MKLFKNYFFIFLLTFLTFSHEKAQGYEKIPKVIAENACWYLSKLGNASLAITYSSDPIYLLMDERGVTPSYVVLNGQYISQNKQTFINKFGEDILIRDFAKSFLSQCSYSLSDKDKQELNALIKEKDKAIKNNSKSELKVINSDQKINPQKVNKIENSNKNELQFPTEELEEGLKDIKNKFKSFF